MVSSIRTAIIDIFLLLTDLPILARRQFSNNVSAIDLKSEMPGHVDIPRLRKGKVGGFFWWVNLGILYHVGLLIYRKYEFRSVYVSCPDPVEAGRNFLGATWRVRYVSILCHLSNLQNSVIIRSP